MRFLHTGFVIVSCLAAFSVPLNAMEYRIKNSRAEGKVFSEGNDGKVTGYVFQEGKYREVSGFISGKGLITITWKKDNNHYKVEVTKIISSKE